MLVILGSCWHVGGACATGVREQVVRCVLCLRGRVPVFVVAPVFVVRVYCGCGSSGHCICGSVLERLCVGCLSCSC